MMLTLFSKILQLTLTFLQTQNQTTILATKKMQKLPLLLITILKNTNQAMMIPTKFQMIHQNKFLLTKNQIMIMSSMIPPIQKTKIRTTRPRKLLLSSLKIKTQKMIFPKKIPRIKIQMVSISYHLIVSQFTISLFISSNLYPLHIVLFLPQQRRPQFVNDNQA